MPWRVLLQGHQFDLETLAGLLLEGELVVKANSDYHYMTGDTINAAPTSAEAYQQAVLQLPLLNGLGRTADASFRPVELAGTVVDESPPQTRHVFVEVKMEGRGRLTVGGTAPGTAQPLLDRASADPALMEALIRFGSSAGADWVDLYKIYEVLRDAAGGADAFRARVGLTKPELDRFTRTANHPGASGDSARHARLSAQAPTNPMTLVEGQQFISHLLRDW